jgi:UDP-N-acetylmuramate: L-alanyl-gamma-D-glutamyl-meso-diaminopimelate ligase
MECISDANDISVYDDFAHHPTAVRLTLDGLRKKVGNARILLALEPRSNTMRAGVHLADLAPALAGADMVWLMADTNIDWDPFEVIGKLDGRGRVANRVSKLLEEMLEQVKAGDHVVFMSNGGFGAAPRRFVSGLEDRARI